MVTLTSVIESFKDEVARKIYQGENLTQKELKKLGGLRIEKAQERLLILDESNEKNLMSLPSIYYHALQGTDRYSIDANSRASKWRITFCWTNEAKTDVELVAIEDTH